MKTTVERLNKIYLATIVLLFAIVVSLTIKMNCTNRSCLKLDNKRCEQEIKDSVASYLSKEVVSFSDVCFATYTGAIGDNGVTQPLFGIGAQISPSEKAKLCVEYTLKTDHNVFECAKAQVMSDVSRACKCFVKKSEISKMLDFADNAVSDILKERATVDTSISAVNNILKRRIEARESATAPPVKAEEETDSWESATADIASLVSKVALKMLFN